MSIRNTVKAIIIKEGKMLVNIKHNILGDDAYGLAADEEYLDLPGGGQDKYETMEEAIHRELLEETGHKCKIIKFAGIYEEFVTNERVRNEFDKYAHKMIYLFVCELTEKVGEIDIESDLGLVGYEWVDINDIPHCNLQPIAARDKIKELIKTKEIMFLGSYKF